MIRNGMTACHAGSYKSFYDAYFYLPRGVKGKGPRLSQKVTPSRAGYEYTGTANKTDGKQKNHLLYGGSGSRTD